MPDPLAGLRERINEDTSVHALAWPDRGQGAPVQVGQVFKLRRVAIEVTRVRRERRGHGFVWIADFTRYHPDRGPRVLTRGAGDGLDEHFGYTDTPETGLLLDDEHTEATLVPLNSPRNLGPPPEPEAIPPHEVESLPRTAAARMRFEEAEIERRAALERMTPPQRVRALREEVRRRGPRAESWREAKAARGVSKRRGRESNPQTARPPR